MRKLSLLILGLFAAIGFSQTIPNARYLSVYQRGAFLLTDTGVRQELSLTSGQTMLIDRAFESMTKQQSAVAAQKEPDEKQFQNIEKAGTNEMLSVLDDGQRKRLSEITLQRVGIRAVVDPLVAKDLNVKEVRGKQIDDLFKILDDREMDINLAIADFLKGEVTPKDSTKLAQAEKTREKIIRSFDLDRMNIEKDRKAATQMALLILEPEEKKRWLAALGKPFVFRD